MKFAEVSTKQRRAAQVRQDLPTVGHWPILWKELFTVGRFRRRTRVGFGLLVAASLLPAVGALAVFTFLYPFGSWDELANFLNTFARVAGTSVACLLFLFVAIRAAGSITMERDRQTLDMLLTTPLSSREILGGKWLGAVLASRRGWLWLGSIWGLAFFGGGLDLSLVPWLFFACLVYSAFFASLGLWFSVHSRGTTTAILGVMIGAVVVTIGHYLLLIFYLFLFYWLYGEGSPRSRTTLQEIMNWAETIHLYGLTPPATLDLIATGDFDYRATCRMTWPSGKIRRWGLGSWCTPWVHSGYGSGRVPISAKRRTGARFDRRRVRP